MNRIISLSTIGPIENLSHLNVRPSPSASRSNFSGVELTRDGVAACVPGILNLADDRQNVGGELTRLGLKSLADALYGAGGSGACTLAGILARKE
jgi:hypothetical protein